MTTEANDFFVFRDQKSGQNVIRTQIKHKPLQINKNILTYCPDNDSEVRIPALLFLGADPDVKNFFLNSYRKQIGCHAFIQSTGNLCCAVCYLNQKNVYIIAEINPISSVYPCFRSTGGPLIIGLLFARSFTFGSGHRTFGRQLGGVQQGSGAVFDIEEDFLHNHKRYDQSGVYGLKVYDMAQPQTPFPDWNQEIVFAIYVCRGARLIVSDDRCYWSNPQVLKNTISDKRLLDRSLLQEGSLLIYEGCTQLSLGFESKETAGPYFMDFRKAFHLFRPTDRFLASILSGQNRFVIFLGSTESQYNSICWQLSIKTNHSSQKQLNGKVDAYLLAPEGGRILDIQPWNPGFEQIYWRHRYQRLYRSVLSPEPSLGRLSFGIPPEQIMKRILFLSGQELFVQIPDSLCVRSPEYFKVPPEDSDIRKYLGPLLEMSVKRDNWAQLNPLIMYPPPAPALYPPIWDKEQNKLKYIGYGTKVKFHSMVKVNGMQYPFVQMDSELYIIRKKRTDDFVWEPNPIRPSLSDNQQLSTYEYRLGSDYLIYHKTNIKIGILGHYYMDGPYTDIPNTFADAPDQPMELITQVEHSPKSPQKKTKEQKQTDRQTAQQQTRHQKHVKKKGQPNNNAGHKK